ncbi:MAG: hypothetical protein V5A46_00385, partial [Haloferacaceae archaeon]
WIAGLVGMVLVAVLVNLVIVGPELFASGVRGAGYADGQRAESAGGPEGSADAGTTDRDGSQGGSEFDWVGSD